MDDVQDTGVINTPEGETGTDSPISEQTPSDSETTGVEPVVSGEKDKAIPYERFQEVNEKYRQTEEKLKELETRMSEYSKPSESGPVDPQAAQVKEALKNYGFVSQEDVQAEINRLKEDQQLEQTLSQLEKSYSGKDGRPKFDRKQVVQYAIDKQISDPEVAYKALNEKAILNWHIENASKRQTGVKTESSDGSGARPAGASDEDLTQSALAGNQDAFETLIARTNIFQKFFGK